LRTIGVDVSEGLVFEGDNNYGRGVLPTPTVLVATVFEGDPDSSLLPQTEDLAYAKYVFREDAFDPVTRLRRGRIYERGDPIFNVKGNDYRLEVNVAFKSGLVVVKWIGTHAEYDERNARR
jgi:mRNA-degrading endonuclease HigB of HigAB toxin-antitoxin module